MVKVITTKAEAPAGEAPAFGATLDDLARDGARRMIAAALRLEAAEFVARLREARDEDSLCFARTPSARQVVDLSASSGHNRDS